MTLKNSLLKRSFSIILTFGLGFSGAFSISAAKQTQKRVACIGNSITYGYLLKDREHDSYPSQLSRMLGKGYEVGNFGHSGATLLNQGHNPYMKLPEFKEALKFVPDIAIIHLGVNDTDPRDWPDFNDQFVSDYLSLIDSLRKVNPKVEISIAKLTPIGAKHFRFRSGTYQWQHEVSAAIERVAQIAGVKLIDFREPLRDRQNLLPDAIHPDAEGARLLAEEAYKTITGKYGPLRLPAYYGSGMVLQRNRPLHINGMADANAKIALTLDGKKYQTTADNRGRWQVVTSPILTGPKYQMSITDGKDLIQYDDILAGEVWLASGQSNMEFLLGSSIDGKEAIANSDDSNFRIYNMQAVARTDNVVWPDSILSGINNLKYFKPSKWQKIGKENAGRFSAVGYHFGRVLRDSLKVPVGIICNAVGGSPGESWVEVGILEREMPEILQNWWSNDYVQKWCQGRALKNLNGDKGLRHPYEPSYLFSAGIRPLGQPDIAGVIWYQGESNAHNTMLNEKIFPMVIESFRNNFRNNELPICFVQLSSLNRPSWPSFRNSQREMANKMQNVWMVVSSDHGDSLDVHPRNKRPIGERLARQALHNIYGYSKLTPYGPTVASARALGNGTIAIRMLWGDNMHGADGNQIRGFEIAEVDGKYFPATAEVKSINNENYIILRNMDVEKPKFVRYGWQPFSRANLVNGNELPASTMKMEVENASDYDIEEGLEHGISAPYAGIIDGKIIMAGGCNFPVDPMGPNSLKKFYKGIYAAEPNTMEWKRIGTLPEASAYGMGVTIGDKIYIIGGTSASSPLNSLYAISLNKKGQAQVENLGSLPFSIDNFAATAINSKIYLAGGNLNGTPSNELWMLDTNNINAGWKKLASMPGNPRVQPIMAATEKKINGRNEECIFLWGGFAGKHNGKDATLNTDGLCYQPSIDSWNALSSPKSKSGEDISFGGAAAAKLKNGKIIVCGGVNKDIFLSALQNQAPDYLQHPIEWYAFNKRVMLYDPKKDSWKELFETPDAARAGAAMVAGENGDAILIGGELKPRIRTSQTLKINP